MILKWVVGMAAMAASIASAADLHHADVLNYKTSMHPAFPRHRMRYTKPALCDPSVKQISGYLDEGRSQHLFFWFFESRNNPATDPVILWLNGGPGCSSMTGLLMELGPCRVNMDGDDTTVNPYSWNSNASIIFLDQPVNVGYSFGSEDKFNTRTAAENVHAFLQIFFKEFSDYAHQDFHIAGESYAGHYIPAIATEVAHGKQVHQGLHASSMASIHLKSVLIGNGLTDPLTQYQYYPKMACNNSYAPVLNETQCSTMTESLDRCTSLIQACYDTSDPISCVPAIQVCNEAELQPYTETGRNPYDVRRDCGDNNLCYDILGSIDKYLNQNKIQHILGAQLTDSYTTCNNKINQRFVLAGDWMMPYVNDIPPLLEQGVRVLIYAGDADYICNWMGNKAWTLKLPWSGHDEFNAANDNDWITASGEKAGEMRTTSDGRLAFLRVYNAGHMVPYDQPENSLDFVNRWIHHASNK